MEKWEVIFERALSLKTETTKSCILYSVSRLELVAGGNWSDMIGESNVAQN
jgi:hypothetical protein